MRLTVRVNEPLEDMQDGESIAVDGVCLTVLSPGRLAFEADVSPETVRRTTLGSKAPGSPVNVERAVRPIDRLGGHIVNGHVDCVGHLVASRNQGEFVEMWFDMDRGLSKYVVEKGSITVDGVSLTVAAVEGRRFSAALIPATLSATTLGRKQIGNNVNVETDILAKYVEKMVNYSVADEITNDERLMELLGKSGFTE